MFKIKKDFTNKEIIEGFCQHNSGVIKFVYDSCYPLVKNYIVGNGGRVKDVEDIFQESLLYIYKKSESGQLVIKNKFSNYFFTICKYRWISELRKKGDKEVQLNDDIDIYSDINDVVDNGFVEAEKRKLFYYYFNQLTKKCQIILNLYCEGFSITEITEIMGYNTEQHTRNRKYMCKKTLTQQIVNNPKFKEISYEYNTL